MAIAPSLYDPPPNSVFASAADWVSGTLFGTVAISLCVLAVAFVGLMLLSGRLAIRDAVRVVIGCFVLLGAPTIALGLRGAADETSTQPQAVVIESPPPAPPLPRSTYDPYAGASLRRD